MLFVFEPVSEKKIGDLLSFLRHELNLNRRQSKTDSALSCGALRVSVYFEK